jgi:hypothetical protein
MQLKRILLLLHVLCIIISCTFVVLTAFNPGSRGTSWAPTEGIHDIMENAAFLFAAVAFFTGLGAMAFRKGKSESLTLAASTIASPFLPFAMGYLTNVLFR